MELTYIDYLFLDLFSIDESRKPNTLYHVLNGKRTVSVLLQTMKMDLTAFFHLFPKLTLTDFESHIKEFQKRKLVTENYCLTQKGLEAKRIFFRTHRQVVEKQRLKYARVLPQFISRTLFLTQVLSELRYQNKNYLPIQARASEQLWIKSFLDKNRLRKDEIGKQFGIEWLEIIKKSQIKQPPLFLEQLEGHDKSRKTWRQIAIDNHLDEIELYVYFQEDWLKIITCIEENELFFPLFTAILKELTHKAGLCSTSAQETYQLWVQGRSALDIVRERRLKPSTINDHFTEIALFYRDFPFEQFLTVEQIQFVEHRPSPNSNLTHEMIKEHFPDIPFFQSRLMQVKGDSIKWRKQI